MKINTVDTVIQDFREGQNIFRRPSVELMVREISRLQARVQELERINKDMVRGQEKLCEYVASQRDKALETVYELGQRIAELEQERRWIPTSEKLPKSGERVLVRMSNFYIVIACYFDKNGYWKNDSGQEIFIVTHWQPLPQPPKMEEE